MQVPFTCWLLGHDDRVRAEAGRLHLKCFRCGRETSGWSISPSGQRRDEAVPRRTLAAQTLNAKAVR
jgi:hypothetical protein